MYLHQVPPDSLNILLQKVIDFFLIPDDLHILGDANQDGILNILDIVILINHILDIEAIELESADLNNDGVVNILDIVVLVNIIL